MADKGLLLVLSGPSGVGKGTVKSAIVENKVFPFEYSVSMTTRQRDQVRLMAKIIFLLVKIAFKRLLKMVSC